MRDDCGRLVVLPAGPPQRVVSLCPSVTETVCRVGGALVGRTRYCTHPAELVADVPEVGGTKKVRVDDVLALQPDLVLAVKEENERADVEALAAAGAPVYVFDVTTVDQAAGMVRTLGRLLHRETQADVILTSILDEWAGVSLAPGMPPGSVVSDRGASRDLVRVLYLIWRKPWMGVAGGSYIDDVLRRGGFVNVLSDTGSMIDARDGELDAVSAAIAARGRYPTLSEGDIRELRPHCVLLSSEPFPFSDRHLEEVMKVAGPGADVRLVDGEMFSWYGWRTQYLPRYLRSLRAQICGA